MRIKKKKEEEEEEEEEETNATMKRERKKRKKRMIEFQLEMFLPEDAVQEEFLEDLDLRRKFVRTNSVRWL